MTNSEKTNDAMFCEEFTDIRALADAGLSELEAIGEPDNYTVICSQCGEDYSSDLKFIDGDYYCPDCRDSGNNCGGVDWDDEEKSLNNDFNRSRL